MFGTSYNYNHVVVFTLTFMSYAFLHATRKAFGNIKPTLKDMWSGNNYNLTGHVHKIFPLNLWNSSSMFNTEDEANIFCGALDTIFMITYAIGLYISGFLGDKFNLRVLLSIGMILSGITVFIFGVVTEWAQFYNKYFYIIVWIFNGLFQSTGWPCAVAIMSNWFGNSRGLVFGIWSACASVGNIIGDALVASVVEYGYDYGLLLPCSLLFSGGLLIYFGIINDPKDIQRTHSEENEPLLVNENDSVQEDEQDENTDISTSEVLKETKKLTFLQILYLPGVILYALAYACLKLVNYAFFFWLPLYLNTKFGWSNKKADNISIGYDVGGIIGGIFAGIISDRMWSRSPVTVIMLVCAIPSLLFYNKCGSEVWLNIFMMGMMGFFIGGPANIISSAISADLGSQKTIAGNADALATVTGIIDGTGSAGAAFGQLLIPFIYSKYQSWDFVFYLFMAMSSLTIICILPIFIKDISKRLRRTNNI